MGLACLLLLAAPASASHFFTVTYSTQWGTQGSGDGQFNNPASIATDAAGNVYVADTDNDRVQKFSSTGAFLSKWGGSGSGDGQFNRPYGIAVSPTGGVYVTDFYNHRVQQFTADGVFVRKWGTGVSLADPWTPTGLAVDAAGKVYVAGASRIQVFGADGTFLTTWGAPGVAHGQFDGAWGVAIDGTGNVYVADKNNTRVEKFTPYGAYLATIGSNRFFVQNFGVDVGPSGRVFVADTFGYRIREFDSTGLSVGTVAGPGTGDGQVTNPFDIATDSAGNLYVADSFNHRIQKFSAVTSQPPPPPLLQTVVVDGDDTTTDHDGCGGGPGSAADACDTIQAGIDAVTEGGVVRVTSPTSVNAYADDANVTRVASASWVPTGVCGAGKGRRPPHLTIRSSPDG